MNPQYFPPQQFGIPPQGLPANRSSPSLGGPPPTSQGFQNVPLGPPKTTPLPQPGSSPSPNVNQFPPNLGPHNPNLRSQVPPNQLPPQRSPSGPSPNQFASKPGDTPGGQSAPPQFMNGPPQFQNGPGFAPQAMACPIPPQGQHPSNVVNKPLGQPQGSFGPPQGPLGPPQGSQGPPQGPHGGPPGSLGPPQGPHGAPPQGPHGAPPQGPHGAPPQGPHGAPPQGPHGAPPQGPHGAPPQGPHGAPQGSLGPPQAPHGAPQGSLGPQGPHGAPQGPNQFGQTNQTQPPRPGQPSVPNSSPFAAQPFSNVQPPMQNPHLMSNPPPSPLNHQAISNQQPPTGPPSLNQQPPSNQPPLGGRPQLNHSQQPPINQPPSNQQPLTGPPPQKSQQPLAGPPQPNQQPPSNQQPFAGPTPLGHQLPTNQPPLAGPPPPNQQPPNNQPPLSGPPNHQQHPLPNPPLNHQPMGAQPPLRGPPSFNNQPPMPNQQNYAYNQPQFGQPVGSFPPNRQFNQPPMPGSNQPPLPGSMQPPMPPGPNQLANQMQGMNVGGPRQFPGAPMKAAMNGDNGPHMPPPQQQYMNGQQMRPPPGPGYPPMPGQQPAPGGVGGYPQPAYQAQQQPKRLDPDQMPSPIQVTQDDQLNRSGIFVTNQKGLVPPLVTTKFIVQDQGNSSPRYIRSSMYNVPISQDIMKQTAVPFSLVISPMARTVDQEYPPPIVNFGELGPVRCIRCKAYMCPFMQFIDSGRRFQCLFCKATTDVPSEYFQHLDHTGQRIDRYERPELVLGTYEFVATAEYCREKTLPKPPAIIFVIDVSYNSVKSGLVHLLCSQIKDIIQNLPIDQGKEKSNMRVGFITYNSSVHFYNIKGNLAAPQMLIVGDIQEMFMPLLDGFLCTPEESGPVIDALMQQIPAMFGDTRETETILLPAILAGLEALKASDCAGKLLVFHSTLPTADGPGKLKNRDDRKLLGTDKERTVLTPQTQAYNQLGQDCVASGCSVDLFIFNNAYIDIATIGQVSRLTGGQVHKYTYFQADVDGERLIKDIITNISRPIAFDAIMRVRTSTGVRPTDFYGHFFMSNTTDMEFAAIDCDKAVAVEVKHDDKLSEEEGAYVQVALLYTSCSGERRLRIINLALKTCSQMAELYRNCDCDTIINYIAKQSTYKLLEHNPKAVKDSIVTRAAQILATYRKNCASPSSAGQLILPECMKLLPLYVNCLLKSDALSGGSDMNVDDRSYVMQEVMTMDIPTSVNYFYPRLVPLHELDPSQDPLEIPSPIRCTVDKMNEQGVYLLENGIHMFLWIGLGVNPDFIQQVFGVQSAIQVDIEKVALPELDNSLSLAVRSIIDEIRVQRHKCMRLTIVRQREKLEPVFKHFLAEDRGTDGSPSYVDFLIHMHKEIRALLS